MYDKEHVEFVKKINVHTIKNVNFRVE